MKSNGLRNSQVTLSGLQSWLILIATIWVISSIGLWWIVKSFLILLAILFTIISATIIILRSWLQRNLIQGKCPICGQGLIGVNNQQLSCPSCNEPLAAVSKTFKRVSTQGTVDENVIDVVVTELAD